MPKTLSTIVWTIACGIVLAASPAFAEEKPRQDERQTRIVWTGASFVPAEIIDLTTQMINQANTGVTAESTRMSRGGMPLGTAIQQPRNLLGVITEGKFDYVVVNEIILAVRTRNVEACAKARKVIDKVVGATKDSGATPVFFCTWLNSTTMDNDFDIFVKDYETLSKKYDGVFAPIGSAWKNAWKHEDEKTLRLYAGDRNHASPRGVYLAACVMFSVFTGESPVGNPAQPDPGKRPRLATTVTPAIARQLQEAAWETFQETRKRTDIRVCVLDPVSGEPTKGQEG